MSFRGDDQRRYGHVPPVQYPVANQQAEGVPYPTRRASFDQGDDAALFAPSDSPARLFQNMPSAPRGEDELFLNNPSASGPSTSSAYQPPYQQHQQPPAIQTAPQQSYNPQRFPRSQSTSLPYHPASQLQYSHPQAAPATQQTPTSPTNNYVPAAYNPAAYASTSVQRNPTYHGYNSQSQSYTTAAASGYGSPNSVYSPYLQTNQGPASQYDQALPSPPPPHSASSSHAPTYDPSAYSASYAGGQYGAYPSNGTSPAVAPYSATSSGSAPYPSYSQIPAGANYASHDPSASYNRASRSNSQASRISSPPSQTTSTLQRHPTNAPLPTRPAELQHNELHWDSNGTGTGPQVSHEQLAQDTIIQDIEAELGASGHYGHPGHVNETQLSDSARQQFRGYEPNTPTSTLARIPGSDQPLSAIRDNRFPSRFDSESDPEGTAGVLAMQQAEQDDQRFSGANPYVHASMPVPVHPDDEESSDSDFGGMDLGLFSGGYAGNLTYGNNVGSPPVARSSHDDTRPLPPPPAYNTFSGGYENPSSRLPRYAEMDYPGAGGLQRPSVYPASTDDGEEQGSLHSRHSGSESPYKDDYPDIFYHPGLSNRPLPSLPMLDTQSVQTSSSSGPPQYQHSYSVSSESRPAYSRDGYSPTTAQQVERSISLAAHSTTPSVQAPARSRTDAAEERRRLHRQAIHQNSHQPPPFDYETGTTPSVAYDMITLPTGRKRKFIPSKLTPQDIKRCEEPWALSCIANWVREMADGEPDLKKKAVEEGLVRLFTAKVPTMNVADAETLSARAVDSMLASGILVPEEEWVKFGDGSISGVLWQLTGSGCYAPKVHEVEISDRCYSYHCTRTLKKANLDDLLSEDFVKQEDWATFHKLTKESIEGRNKKEIERQNVLHEIVTSEEGYMNQLEVLRVLYRDQLRSWDPPILAPKKMDQFLNAVFGKVDAVQATNKDHLLAQLKYRQQEQGPWITGFSDLFREWIRKAKVVYIEYAEKYPYAVYLFRREAERNLLFQTFLDRVRSHKRSERLDWTHFLKTPITRLQRYSFLLETVEKNMLQDSEEKANLAKAIAEIKAVTRDCDQKVADMQSQVQMAELGKMLVLRSGFQAVLNLDHLGRELIHQGPLQRMGSKGVRWVDTHALLFDHYLIIAKTVGGKDGREKKYDVSKEPIPMPLLLLESFSDDAVSRQKGITAPLGRTTTSVSDTRLNRLNTNGTERPGLEHQNTSSSASSGPQLGPAIATDPEGKIIYPFRVKHLGNETYTLYAKSPQARQEWCSKIMEAKARHAEALHGQNAEPFRLRVLADCAFAYDSVAAIGKQPGVPVRGTPLDRAIRSLEEVYGPGRGPPPVSRANVNCATGFSAFGKSIIAIGTDYGVFISDTTDPRGWQRTVSASKVTQIAVLEEFSVCLIIADRSLISYPLDVVAPVSNFPAPVHDNSRRAPQRLAKDVSFFAAGRMKDRMLVFYKRKEGVHTAFFKVLEPVFHRTTEKKSRWLGGGGSSSRRGAATESFRDYDEFFFPTDCYSLNLFQSYIAVSTSKGFELLTLDKKQPMSIPDVKQPAISDIASRIRDQRPLGMFRLNDQEFLLTYEDCAVYVDKHGDVSRTLIMEYSGRQKKAKGATLYGQYLILFNDDYVEVRNAENGRLRQIIAGRDVRFLDYGVRGPTGAASAQAAGAAGPTGLGNWVQPASGLVDSKTTVKIAMTHPEVPGMQIVLEMLLNDGHTEK